VQEEGEKLPIEVTDLLGSILRKDEDVMFSALSDIDEDGKFGQRRLILTRERIVALNPVTKHVVQHSLTEVRATSVKDYIGNAELLIETENGFKGLLRFSRAHLEDFYNAARLIDKIARKEIRPENIDTDVLNDYLTKKKTIRKSQTLKWLVGYLRPNLHHVILALVLSLFITGISLTPPYLMKILADLR